MKKKLLPYMTILLVLTSCGASDSAVREFVSQALEAFQNGDRAAIAEMYPGAAGADGFATDFKADSIQIHEDNMTGGYKVSLGNGNWFVVTGNEKEAFKIVDSRGLFAYPKEQMDFAHKTGWVMPDMNDQAIQKAFADTTFYDFLFDKTLEQLKKQVTAEVNWNKSNIQCMTDVMSNIVAQVTNNGSHEIMGDDYSVSVWSDMEGPRAVKGKNIAPKETIFLSARFPAEGAARQTYNAAVKWNIDGRSKREVVSRYYEVEGGEYNAYLKTK